LAGALLAGPVLTACDQPDVAALVDTEKITQDQLATITEDYNFMIALYAQAEPAAAADILSQVILDRVAAHLIEATGDQALVEATQALTIKDFATWLRENGVGDDADIKRVEAMGPDAFYVFTQSRVEVLQGAYDSGQVSTEELEAALEKVEVNPRYGQLPQGEQPSVAIEAVSPPWRISLDLLTLADAAGTDSDLAPVPEPVQ
jgi:hypothetical protein